MAKLGAYYALCPLIDANSILGFSEELGKDMVIVTLGKNISSRYKVRIYIENLMIPLRFRSVGILNFHLFH